VLFQAPSPTPGSRAFRSPPISPSPTSSASARAVPGSRQYGRPSSPPRRAADRLSILRTAFEQTIEVTRLVQEAESSGLHPLYHLSDELQKYVADAYKMSPEVWCAPPRRHGALSGTLVSTGTGLFVGAIALLRRSAPPMDCSAW